MKIMSKQEWKSESEYCAVEPRRLRCVAVMIIPVVSIVFIVFIVHGRFFLPRRCCWLPPDCSCAPVDDVIVDKLDQDAYDMNEWTNIVHLRIAIMSYVCVCMSVINEIYIENQRLIIETRRLIAEMYFSRAKFRQVWWSGTGLSWMWQSISPSLWSSSPRGYKTIWCLTWVRYANFLISYVDYQIMLLLRIRVLFCLLFFKILNARLEFSRFIV